mgnify:CR=1 FL=1
MTAQDYDVWTRPLRRHPSLTKALLCINKVLTLLVYLAYPLLLLALLLVYTVVKQTMPDIIPLLQSGDEEALEAYLERDMSFTGILCMALLQMVQVWSIVISGVIVNVAAGVVYGVWRGRMGRKQSVTTV